MNGTVKWFNHSKGFGFIAGEDDKDYFVHVSFCENAYEPQNDDKVSFTVAEGDRGPQAKNVMQL